MIGAETKLIDTINALSGRYSGYEIFSDWVKMAALSFANSCLPPNSKLWQEREQDYLDTARKYSHDELVKFCEMLGLLCDGMEEDIRDILGEVYMKAGLGSSITGQFFTPFNISHLCAQLGIDLDEIDRDSMDPIMINEPSCGGGGMIIAAVRVLHDAGIDVQCRLRVVAQDLDWKGVYMTYLQLSILGIRAKVVQGDTLGSPYDPGRTDPAHVLITPAEMMGGLP